MYIKERKNDWVLGNRKFDFIVIKNSGNVNSFFIKDKKINLWGSKIAGVKIYDELQRREYSDLKGDVKIIFSNVKKSQDSATLEIRKRFQGADFLIYEYFHIFPDHFRWDLNIEKGEGKDKTIQINYFIPLPERQPWYIPGWWFWAPTYNAPGEIEKLNHLTLSYDHTWEHISIPALSLYNSELDIGLTMVKPFEMPSPGFRFKLSNVTDFNIEKARSIEVKNLYLGLRDTSSPKTSLILTTHEGDWRPGLGWIFNKYKDYFLPKSKKTHNVEGVMIGPLEVIVSPLNKDLACINEETFSNLKQVQTKWCELQDDSHTNVVWQKPTYNPKMKKAIQLSHKYGIAILNYWQTGDAGQEFVEKDFSSSIVKDEDGKYTVGWVSSDGKMKTWYMNFDSKLSWGKHLIAGAKKILDMYPETDGFFIDNLCYKYVDFGHDDKLTMVGNKPCYKVTFAFPETIGKLCRLAHSKGKTVFCNGPLNVEIQKDIDGHMAETTIEVLGYVAYLGLAKPIVYLSYDMSEKALLSCLKYGCFPSAVVSPTDEQIKLFQRYLPLIEFLRGKRWVFSPHALRLPEGIDGNIFETRDNNYVVTLLPKIKSVSDKGEFTLNIPIEVNLDDAKKIKSLYLFSVDYEGRLKLKFKRKGKRINFNVPRHATASMILLDKKE